MSGGKTCRVIEVGVGGRGADWAPMLHQEERIKLVGAVEVNSKIAAQHQEKYAVKEGYFAESIGELLKETEADLAVIATPSVTHPKLVDEALDAGLHVVVEKPFTVNFAEAKRLARKAKALGLQLVVAQNYRYWGGAKAMRQAVADEHIGKPEYALINHMWFASPHVTVNSYMRRLPHMHAYEMSCHLFDLMRFVFNRNAVKVYGKTHDPSWSWYTYGGGMAIATIEFEGGLVVNYHGSFISTAPPANSWSIEGAKGGLQWIGFGQPKFVPNGQIFDGAKLLPGVSGGEQPLDVPSVKHDLQMLLYDTLDAIEGGPIPQTTAEDNLFTLAICDAVARSSDLGMPVTPAVV